MKSTAIIQVRLQSTRLKKKALLPLGDRPLIYHVAERAKNIDGVSHVVLAAGEGADNSPLEEIAAELRIDFFEGSGDNVLERFHQVSKLYDSQYYVRITGDNPLTDYDLAGKALHYAQERGADHCFVSGIPVGTGVEIVSKGALDLAYEKSSENHHFEHVTPFIKENPQLFKMEEYRVETPIVEKYRLTVDTAEDYELQVNIYDALYRGRPIPLGDVIEFLGKNPQLINLNSHVEQRSMKHSSIKE